MNSDSTTTTGAFYLSLIPLSVFMIIFDEMVREKVYNLRIGLLAMGCSNTAFWISWIVTGIFFSGLMSILIYLTGFLFGFSIFVKTPFYVLFLHQFSISLAYVSIALALTSIVSTQTLAYTISYSLVLISVITVAALSESIFIYKLFYNLSMPQITIYIRNVFEFLPVFHFAKIYGDITRVTCFHINPENMLWTQGREFTFDDLFLEKKGKLAT